MDGKPGLGLSAFACLLTVIGLAIPYWSNNSNLGGENTSAHLGLWQSCQQGVCISFTVVSSILATVRALEILAFLLMLSATGWAAFKIFKSPETMYYTKLSAVASFVAAGFAIIGCIVYATSSVMNSTGVNLHAGFALCIIGGVASIAAGVVYLIAKP